MLFRGDKASLSLTQRKVPGDFSLLCPSSYQLYQLKAPGHDSGQNGIHAEHNNWHGAAVPEKVVMRPIPPHSGLS